MDAVIPLWLAAVFAIGFAIVLACICRIDENLLQRQSERFSAVAALDMMSPASGGGVRQPTLGCHVSPRGALMPHACSSSAIPRTLAMPERLMSSTMALRYSLSGGRLEFLHGPGIAHLLVLEAAATWVSRKRPMGPAGTIRTDCFGL